MEALIVVGKLSRYMPVKQRTEIKNFLPLCMFLCVACIHKSLSVILFVSVDLSPIYE